MTDAGASRREGRVWRLLVAIQVAVVAAVVVAILVVWVIGHAGGEYASR